MRNNCASPFSKGVLQVKSLIPLSITVTLNKNFFSTCTRSSLLTEYYSFGSVLCINYLKQLDMKFDASITWYEKYCRYI